MLPEYPRLPRTNLDLFQLYYHYSVVSIEHAGLALGFICCIASRHLL
jgi:hypothetical protein